MTEKPARHKTSDDEMDQTVEQRHFEPDGREHDLDVREAQMEARDATRAERLEDTRGIHADADERDELADNRDWDADKRDLAANTKSWLNQDDAHGEALADRQAAHQDRKDARADRLSSAVDRALLTDDDDPRDRTSTEAP